MTKIKFEVGPGEVQTIRNLSFDGKGGTITATKPNMEEILEKARPVRYLTDTERASMERATRELDAELKQALKDRPRRPAKPRDTISGTNPTLTVLDDPTEP